MNSLYATDDDDDSEIRLGGVELIAEAVCDELRELLGAEADVGAEGRVEAEQGEQRARSRSLRRGGRADRILGRDERGGLYYDTV